jgi:hypothetical protein
VDNALKSFAGSFSRMKEFRIDPVEGLKKLANECPSGGELLIYVVPKSVNYIKNFNLLNALKSHMQKGMKMTIKFAGFKEWDFDDLSSEYRSMEAEVRYIKGYEVRESKVVTDSYATNGKEVLRF